MFELTVMTSFLTAFRRRKIALYSTSTFYFETTLIATNHVINATFER